MIKFTNYFSNKNNFLLVCILASFIALYSCKNSSTNNEGGDTFDVTKPESVTTSADANIPDSLGGNGFEAWASKNGWETNSDFDEYGDPNAKKGGSITIQTPEYPPMFRPIGKESNHQIISDINSLMFETLLGIDGKTLKFVPGLASHWKISPDKMTFWFRIDPRAKWVDGNPVIADDVVASYKLNMDEGIEEPSNQMVYGKYEKPEALSKYIVKIKCKVENWRNLLYIGSSMFILPAHYISKVDGKAYITKYQYEVPTTSGPYQINTEKTEQGNIVVLKRNPNYWAKDIKGNVGAFNFDEIRYLKIEDDKLAEEKFKKGEFDVHYSWRAQWWAENITPDKVDALKKGAIQKLKVFNYNPTGTMGLAFNMREEPFNDIRVRKAFGMAWNIDQLIEKLFFKEYQRCNSYFQGSVYANSNNPMPKYDPTAAIKLLNEAGYTRKAGEKWLTKNGKKLEVDLEIVEGMDRIYTPFQSDLEQIGIKLNLTKSNSNTRFEHLMQRKFKVTIENWSGLTFPNPETSFKSELADKNDNNNIYGYKNPEVDKLCDLYDKSYDSGERIKIIQKIDSLVVAQTPTAFGWVAPYTVRAAYWNKFGMPKTILSYTGNESDIVKLWWYDPEKAAAVDKYIKDGSAIAGTSPDVKEYDPFGKRKK